ncbi:MAG: glutamate-1-semialdehyde 2,1-aminomutase [candidate division WS1 bacterium]|jgi:glutamate-1-semialdehyde 2,1-aminomutase|nr:glutamate-1-semialdehyde 2,1-aminomutase [candidate division WS1 bacterium]
MDFTLSGEAGERSRQSIPGGVNSPVRAFSAVDAPQIFAASGSGARLTDLDGNSYVDYLMCWGALILGHADPEVTAAIAEAAARGTGYGLSTGPESELAELIREAVPTIELLRMVNSGTEAVMSAIRVARGYTGRDAIIKFDGCYHGHSDALLAKAGSGLRTFGLPSSAGVPEDFTRHTLVARYNDLESVEQICAVRGDDVAAILVEPVAGNMGVVAPQQGFLQGLREIADRIGAVLIFDEVITGFRVGWGGAQGLYGVAPDMICLGKIIGGGLPVGAFGGRAEIMRCLAPEGPVYQAGTLSGNPVVVAAGNATLRRLRDEQPHDELSDRAARLAECVTSTAEAAGVPVRVERVGPMFTIYFADHPVTDADSAARADFDCYGRFFRLLLERGVLLPPSGHETAFVSTCHTDDVIEESAAALSDALRALPQT